MCVNGKHMNRAQLYKLADQMTAGRQKVNLNGKQMNGNELRAIVDKTFEQRERKARSSLIRANPIPAASSGLQKLKSRE